VRPGTRSSNAQSSCLFWASGPRVGSSKPLMSMSARSACAAPFVASGDLAWPTSAVVAGQVAFMVVAYAHAALSGDLNWGRAHISAVLDHDVRCVLCACIGALSLYPMVVLEWRRQLPQPELRVGLAGAVGLGIVAVCVMRESDFDTIHRLAAAFTFGCAMLLVWRISSTSGGVGHRAALTLVMITLATGVAQAVHLVGLFLYDVIVLPSWLLGFLECALVLDFAMCMSACMSAGQALSVP
jgi:hypothetical protein